MLEAAQTLNQSISRSVDQYLSRRLLAEPSAADAVRRADLRSQFVISIRLDCSPCKYLRASIAALRSSRFIPARSPSSTRWDACSRMPAIRDLRTCLRSAAKPFQAIPLLEYGGVDEYELTGEEIALTCASHGGEPLHVATAAALLRKGEFDEDDLLCGAHVPYDEKAAAELRAAGEEPSPLHNNCSGKHAGMLLATQVMDVPSARYIDAEHPLQELMRSTLARLRRSRSGRDPDRHRRLRRPGVLPLAAAHRASRTRG